MERINPKESWLRTSQIRMRYLDWEGRPGGSGPAPGTVVLALHGLASSCHWYDLVMPYLAGTYRCIALEQRGHGRTDQPAKGYDWQTLATDVVEAMDQLGLEQAAILGHSWGGHVALSVASKYPERLSRLVMIDGGFLDPTKWEGSTWDTFSERFRPRQVSGARQEFLEGLRQQLSECWSDQLEAIVMSMVSEGPDGAVRDILEPSNHAQVLEAMWNEPPSTMYHLVRCPTLIVAAGPREDWKNHEFNRMREVMASAAHSGITGSILEWIPETMHDIGYHKPEELAQALRTFLSEG